MIQPVNGQGNEMADNTQRVVFHPDQLAHLEKMFPRLTMDADATEAQMRIYFGQQGVLDEVRRRTLRRDGLSGALYPPEGR